MALRLSGIILPEGRQRDVFVVDSRFTFVPVEDAQTVLDGGYMIPGLVDMHAHLGLASPAPGRASAVQRTRASARAHLEAGVLAIREPGGPDRASAGIGPKDGLPRTYTAGRFLAPPGVYFPGLAREVSDEELPDAAEEEARASGGWAKVIGDLFNASGQPNYRRATLIEAARRVHALGARLTIHACTTESIENAIEAGFDSIEHGMALRDDLITAMVARGIVLVPTLSILTLIPPVLEDLGLARQAARETVTGLRRHPEMVRRASEAGVLILAGTDAGMTPHGMVREEIRLLRDAGLSPETALAAGSWEARRFLGLPGIEEGAPADIVAYKDDPRGDPELLARPAVRILDGHLLLAAK